MRVFWPLWRLMTGHRCGRWSGCHWWRLGTKLASVYSVMRGASGFRDTEENRIRGHMIGVSPSDICPAHMDRVCSCHWDSLLTSLEESRMRRCWLLCVCVCVCVTESVPFDNAFEIPFYFLNVNRGSKYNMELQFDFHCKEVKLKWTQIHLNWNKDRQTDRQTDR